MRRRESGPAESLDFCGVTGVEKAMCAHCAETRREASGLLLKTGARFVPKEADPSKPLADSDKGIDAIRRKAFSKEATLAAASMDDAMLGQVIDGSVTPAEASKPMEAKKQEKMAAALDALRQAVSAERDAMMAEEDLDQRQKDDAAIAQKGEYRVALERALPKLPGAQLDAALLLIKDIAATSIKKRAARPPSAKAS